MGMYDTIGNGYQVKLFSIPVCSPTKINHEKVSSVYCMGGNLRYYNYGDVLPLKTWWYQYPENFVMIDTDDYEETVFHVVREGRLFASLSSPAELTSALESHRIDGFYDYYGNEITGMNSILDIYEYLKISKELREIQIKYAVMAGQYRKDMYAVLQKKNRTDEDEKEIEKLQKKIEEVKELEEKENSPIWTHFKEKFCQHSEHSIFERYGMYLDCIAWEMTREKKNDYYKFLVKEFNDYISQNQIHVEDYFSWLDPSEENRSIITYILNNMDDPRAKLKKRCKFGIDDEERCNAAGRQEFCAICDHYVLELCNKKKNIADYIRMLNESSDEG